MAKARCGGLQQIDADNQPAQQVFSAVAEEPRKNAESVKDPVARYSWVTRSQASGRTPVAYHGRSTYPPAALGFLSSGSTVRRREENR